MYPVTKINLDSSISVGMAAYGNCKVTQKALKALFASAEGDFELLLVDDNSPDETRNIFLEAQNFHKNTRLFGFNENKEYSGSLNAILSHAAGELVLFLSNDIYVTPSYLRQIILAAKRNNSHGIIRGCSNFVDNGGLATHNISVPPDISSWRDLAVYGGMIENNHNSECLFDTHLTGDAFLVTRAVIDKIGVIDPFFYGYFADPDYGLRARIAGFQLVLARSAFAYHDRAANFDYLPNTLREKKLNTRFGRVYENWARFKIKYGLPVELPYAGTSRIDWGKLSSQDYVREKHYISPKDYSEYLIK